LPASKAEVGEIAIADRNVGTDEQQAVDGRQEAAEESIGRGEPDRSGIGHFGLISGRRRLPYHCLTPI
jgi:hypothetical protein